MKNLYNQLCEKEDSIPLFSQAWWLDAVAGENWDVAIVTKGENIVAAMPYTFRRSYGFNLIYQPPLTQTMGPWIKPSAKKYAKRLSQEKALMEELIQQLPSYDYFSQSWHYTLTNWLPFYWNGFCQTTRYTYRLNDLAKLDTIWNGLQENIRREIKKASTRHNLIVREDIPLSTFYGLNAKVFERQRMKMPYTKPFLERVDAVAHSRGCRKIFIAEDSQGRPHAGIYILWDKNSAYYLIGGGDPELRNSGATSLCMWKAIEFASKVTSSFDFEGSMLEPVERYFRSFGATQTPYFRIKHTPSKIIRTAMTIRDIFN